MSSSNTTDAHQPPSSPRTRGSMEHRVASEGRSPKTGQSSESAVVGARLPDFKKGRNARQEGSLAPTAAGSPAKPPKEHRPLEEEQRPWIPACAGMTVENEVRSRPISRVLSWTVIPLGAS